MARVSLGHGGHTQDYDLSFVEGHGHDHIHEELRGLEGSGGEYQDAHELAHANDIGRQFADRNVTTWQIVMFGLTGGLIPYPAAISVLLLCLQLKEFSLGFTLVLCFSIGLAITLVTVGAAAALSVRHATKRWSWFGTLRAQGSLFLQRAHHTCRSLCRLSRLEWTRGASGDDRSSGQLIESTGAVLQVFANCTYRHLSRAQVIALPVLVRIEIALFASCACGPPASGNVVIALHESRDLLHVKAVETGEWSSVIFDILWQWPKNDISNVQRIESA